MIIKGVNAAPMQNNTLKQTDSCTQVASTTKDKIRQKLTRGLGDRLMNKTYECQSVLINPATSSNPVIHPNWECLACRRLNQLVKKRASPSSSHPSFNSGHLPSQLDSMKEIHLCHSRGSNLFLLTAANNIWSKLFTEAFALKAFDSCST